MCFLDLDPDLDPSIQQQNIKENMITLTFLNLLFLKTNVNVQTVSTKQKNEKKPLFFVILLATEEINRIQIRNTATNRRVYLY